MADCKQSDHPVGNEEYEAPTLHVQDLILITKGASPTSGDSGTSESSGDPINPGGSVTREG